MAFADPQSVTIDGTAYSCARAFTGTDTGKFVAADASYTLSVQPRVLRSSRTQRTAAMVNSKVTADPLVSTTNVRVSDTVRLIIDRPANGYSDAEVVKQVVGFFAWLTASTNANLNKLVAGEN